MGWNCCFPFPNTWEKYSWSPWDLWLLLLDFCLPGQLADQGGWVGWCWDDCWGGLAMSQLVRAAGWGKAGCILCKYPAMLGRRKAAKQVEWSPGRWTTLLTEKRSPGHIVLTINGNGCKTQVALSKVVAEGGKWSKTISCKQQSSWTALL